jgi:uroporphyrinogen decarboxylase
MRAVLDFKKPDQLPTDLWIHPATRMRYGAELEALLEKYPLSMTRVFGPMDRQFYSKSFESGSFVDFWGSRWEVLRSGMLGEVKEPVLQNLDRVSELKVPYEALKREMAEKMPDIKKKVAGLHAKGVFVTGGYIELYQCMQFIRGTEDLLCDIGLEEKNAFVFRDMVADYFREYLTYWLDTDVDAIFFADDFGSQRAPLMSLESFRKFFYPFYKEIFKRIHDSGKYVFFHSCGYIYDFYQDLIECGADAINSQVSCMGYEKVSASFAGKVTFWGEIDRQTTLCHGSPQEVRNEMDKMKKLFYVNGGGLIGHSVAGVDVPLENIKTLLSGWN